MSTVFQSPPPEPVASTLAPVSLRDISELDVPLSRLEADIKALVARQRMQAGVAAEARHQLDPTEVTVDAAFARLAVEHPDTCAGAADYPGWTPGGTA